MPHLYISFNFKYGVSKIKRCLLHEVTLLDTRLCLHDQVLGGLTCRMWHTARPRAQWNGWSVVILGLASKADVTQRVLYDGLQDVGRLHADLLREAAMWLALARSSLRLRLHVEFVDDNDTTTHEPLEKSVQKTSTSNKKVAKSYGRGGPPI